MTVVWQFILLFSAFVFILLVSCRDTKKQWLKNLTLLFGDIMLVCNAIFIIVLAPVHIFFFHEGDNCTYCNQLKK